MSNCSRRSLVVVAKWPEPGQVKTRLAAGKTPAWAARVAHAFLADLVDRLDDFPARRVVAYAPAEAAPGFAELVQGRFELTPQPAGDLGQRLAAVVHAERVLGQKRIVLLGTDSPTLPLDWIETAFDVLDRADVVIGPATDGGYYLVGCAGEYPELFTDIPWGKSDVLHATVRRCAQKGWRLALLPPWYDIDTPADWQMLRGHLAALHQAGIDPELPRTERLCAEE